MSYHYAHSVPDSTYYGYSNYEPQGQGSVQPPALAPPIPPNPYHSTSPPSPPPGAYNPTTSTWQQPTSPNGSISTTRGGGGDAGWRESRIISMYGGDGGTAPNSPDHHQQYPNGIGNGNTMTTQGTGAGARYFQGIQSEQPRPFVSPSTGATFVNHSPSIPTTPPSIASNSTYVPLPPPPSRPPTEPVTFVSSSGATFTRNTSISTNSTITPSTSSSSSSSSSTQPAYPSYASPRSNSSYYRTGGSEKRPLNPPPLPEYYHQPSQPLPQTQFQPAPRVVEEQGRLSNESAASERYSVYSYPGSIESNSTASASNGTGPPIPPPAAARTNGQVPDRKQSLEHLKSLSLRDQQQPQSLPHSSSSYFGDSSNYPDPIPEGESYNPPPLNQPRTRQPTILMSPPLESFPPVASASPTPSDSYSSCSPARTNGGGGEIPHSTNRNHSIDTSWSSSVGGGGGRSNSYGSSSFNHGTFTSTVQTSPSPSPSLSQSYSFSSQDQIGRRPSQATLSPHASSIFRSTSNFTSDSYSHLSPSASMQDLPAPNSEDSARFLNPALLSNLAVWLKDHVPRGPRLKGSVEHYGFTGQEIVDTILKALPSSSPSPSPTNSLAPPPPPPGALSVTPTAPSPTTGSAQVTLPLPSNPRPPVSVSRKLALQISRTLQQSLFFHEVDFSTLPLSDSPNSTQVYSFIGGSEGEGEELPSGVTTELTRCISLVCTKENAEGGIDSEGNLRGGCYSFSCPNRPRIGLQRVGSTLSTNSATIEAPLEEAENWASSVPKSILDSLDKKEIAYQNQIFELIHGEQKYFDDLNLIETGFVEPLKNSNPPIIQPHRLPHFLSSILLNIAEIRQHSSTFLSALRTKQQESLVIRGGIGKIVLMSAVEWGKAYITYTTGFPMADWLFKEERELNPRFNELLMDFHKRPEASKRGFDTFHNRATFRGLRYILLLEQILKNAPEDTESDRQDREYLEEAIKVIRQQGKEADNGVGEMKGKVSLREWEKNLVRKQGDLHDLELLDESRRHFMSSKVYRRPEGSGFTDQFQEAHLILLDNYLVTTKAPRPDRDGKQRYLISRRPVPLDLIQLKASSFSEPPVPRSSGFHLRSNRSAGSPQPSAPSAAYPAQDSSLLYPISFFQMGRFDGLVYVYVDTPAQRLEWEKKLKEAVSLRVQRQEANRVVRLEALADATFGTTSTIGSLNTSSAQGSNQFGKPTCSTPLQTIDGLWLIIAGCQEGIFIGWRGRPSSMQQVVHLSGITQCAVLPDFSFLLVVANKVLVAYALEALIPTKTANKLDQANKAPQRLSGQKDVSFFRVGKVGDTDPRTLVIYAKKSGVKESVFKALEPVSQNDRAKAGSSGHRFLGFGTGRPEWFRVHKEFFMPSLVTSLQFQRSKLALIGSRGVEIMDLESMRTMTVPDFPSVRHNRNFAALAKRCEEVPTLGMFRIADSKFLLVYADFAFHVGRHGEPIEGPCIEWESKPEQVAFCFPYIFAISPTIIEIRNAFSGRLAQFITGSHIHLTFDGSAISSSRTPPVDLRPSRGSSLSSASLAQSSIEAETPVEKRLHVSMRTGAYHVLYELIIVA